MEKETLLVHWKRKSKKANTDIYDLWKECFGDTDKYLEYYNNWVMKSNTVLCLYKEDDLASMIHLNPYMVSFLGEHTLAYYIVGVATKESYRKQGMMRKLMVQSFSWMHKEKVPFTYLCPIDKAIYSPFDFKVMEDYELWNVEMIESSSRSQEGGIIQGITTEITTFGLMNEAVWSELSDFANDRLHTLHDIYIPRSNRYFEELSNQLECCGGGFLILRKNNQIVAYLAFMNDGLFHIVELLSEENVRAHLLQEAYLMYQRIHKRSDDEMEHKVNSFKGSIMGRIVSLYDYVNLLRSKVERTYCVEIIDKEIQENNGVYDIVIAREGSEIKVSSNKPEVTFTIGEFFIHCQGLYSTFIHDVV